MEHEGTQRVVLVPANNQTGFKGVYHTGLGSYRAKAFEPGRRQCSLGCFATPEEAALAYAWHIGPERAAAEAAAAAERVVAVTNAFLQNQAAAHSLGRPAHDRHGHRLCDHGRRHYCCKQCNGSASPAPAPAPRVAPKRKRTRVPSERAAAKAAEAFLQACLEEPAAVLATAVAGDGAAPPANLRRSRRAVATLGQQRRLRQQEEYDAAIAEAEAEAEAAPAAGPIISSKYLPRPRRLRRARTTDPVAVLATPMAPPCPR